MINEAPPDLAMLGATLVLLLWPWTDDKDGPGIISESEAWQGFSNSGVVRHLEMIFSSCCSTCDSLPFFPRPTSSPWLRSSSSLGQLTALASLTA